MKTVDKRGVIFLYSVNSDLQRFVLTLLNPNELFRSNLEDCNHLMTINTYAYYLFCFFFSLISLTQVVTK